LSRRPRCKVDMVRPGAWMKGRAEDECQRSGKRRALQEPPHSPYREAKRLGVKGRSKMDKGSLRLLS
jgi:hypothetical protein